MGYVDVSSRKAPFTFTHEGLNIEVEAECQQTGPLGDIRHFVVHWTAGNYTQAYDAYHYCVVWDKAKQVAHIVKVRKIAAIGQHAFKFNSHAVGLSYCAMHESGRFPIGEAMLDEGARFTAEFLAWHQLDPRGSKDGVPILLDHYMVDRLPQVNRREKPDIHDGGYWDKYQQKVLAHYDALKAGREQFKYKGILVD